MSLPQGVNFRGTAGYVTDGPNTDYELANASSATYPHVTAQGNTIGWEAAANSANRNSGNIAQLAGINYTSVNGRTWRMDLPSTGTYDIRVAAGDAVTTNRTEWSIRDTNTKLGSDICTGATSAAQRFKDATDTEYTNTTWAANNTAVTKTFTTTICRLWSERTTGNTVIAHFYIDASASGVTGTSAATNANDTSASSGTTTVVGSSATTNANDASSASGTTTIVGTSAATNANDASSASGAVGGGVSGTSAATNADDASAAVGTTTVVGASATTNANDTSSAAGWAGSVSGTSAATNANDVSSAQGTATDNTVIVGGGVWNPYKKTGETEEQKRVRRIAQGIIKALDRGEDVQKLARRVAPVTAFLKDDIDRLDRAAEAYAKALDKRSAMLARNDALATRQLQQKLIDTQLQAERATLLAEELDIVFLVASLVAMED